MYTTLKQSFGLLTKPERRQLYLLISVMVVSALMEVGSIASITPFLTVAADEDAIHDNQLLSRLYHVVGRPESRTFVIYLGLMTLAVLVATNVMRACGAYMSWRYMSMRNHSISVRLLAKYLHQPYAFFLDQNAADLSKNVLNEVDQFVSGILMQSVELIAKSSVAVFIVILLIAVDPVLAITVTTALGGTFLAIYGLIRRRFSALGKVRTESNTERFKATAEAFAGIKEIKVLSMEPAFIRTYTKSSKRFAKARAAYRFMAEMPRYALETVAFGGIIVLVLYLLAAMGGIAKAIPFIGLYAFAAYRLLPALQAIFKSMSGLRYNSYLLGVLHEDLAGADRYIQSSSFDELKTSDVPVLSLRKELELREVTFHYPGTQQPLFENLNLTVQVGTSVGIVGLTGSGKTTLVDIILGLLECQEGRVAVDGVPINHDNRKQWQLGLGYVPQDIYLLDDSIARNIALGERDEDIDMSRVVEAAQLANIHAFIEEDLPGRYETVVGERGVRLSGGQRQRIGIARALYRNPSLLVLDEATSALDSVTENNVFDAVLKTSKPRSIIMIAHRLSTVAECDTIYVLDQGRVVGHGQFSDLIQACPHFSDMVSAAQDNSRKMASVR